MNDSVNIMIESLETFWLQLIGYLPRLLAAVLLLLAGWIVAKILRRAVIKFLKMVRFDVAAEKAGIEDFLLQGGVRYTAVTLVAGLIYWFVLLTVFLAVLNSLGLQSAAELFHRVVLYLPNVLVATLVVLFGSLLGRVVQSVSFTYLNNIGVEGASFMSHAAQWAILIFVVSIALEQLSIGGAIPVSAFQILFGAACLALALAFGLGGRRWAAHILDQLWKK
jgi:Mechanosensitive ion channel, conserved TM helix